MKSTPSLLVSTPGLLLFAFVLTACTSDPASNSNDTTTDSATPDSASDAPDPDDTAAQDTGQFTETDSTAPSATDSESTDTSSVSTPEILVGHHQSDLAAIPESAIALAKQHLHIVYQHSSHGSQLISGMETLERYPDFGVRFQWSDDGSAGLDLDDLGIPQAEVADLSAGDSVDENGDTPWVAGTRALLNDPAYSHINVVMWSWCSINGHNAQRYVDNMETLIAEYPNVAFVFMTGHAEGLGVDMVENGVHYNNELIRNHCAINHRVLYDFADIEGYDPAGNEFWSKNMNDALDYDGGNWGVEWIAGNPANIYSLLTTGEGIDNFSGPAGCAHSASPPEARINCVRKAVAAWYLFARLAGWAPVN